MSRVLRLVTVVTLVAIAVAACGATAVPSSTPNAATASASPVATASSAATGSPSAEPSASPSTASSSTGAGASADVVAAAEATLAEGTARVDQRLEFQGSGVIPDDTSATTVGQASFGKPRQMRLATDLTELGQGPIDMIVDDNLVYMRGTAFEQLAGEGKWLLVDLESDNPAAAPFKSLATGQNDVGIALVYLYGVTDATDTGDEQEIRGVNTRRYEGTADLEAAAEAAPEEFAEPLQDAIASLRVGGIEHEVETVVWIGDDGLVHRVRYVYALGPSQGGGHMETEIDFSDFGAPVELDVPPDEDVVNVEDVAPGASPG
jgi:hypothetical protein